ncbi:hypothetical protein BX600DRAFT_471997 [Xylariales sp. PMI_506]|nr:hypothetical protein BX600DRAFT_471997 [Xylariales sp. PMI_506]
MITDPLLAATATVLLVAATVVFRHWQNHCNQRHEEALAGADKVLAPPTPLAKCLKEALPDSVILSTDDVAFKKVTTSYWAKNHREVLPACFVQPSSVEQVQAAVSILKQEYDRQSRQGDTQNGLFAVKAGGAAPGVGCSSIQGGVVIDLARFRDLTVSEDRSSVTIGAGWKWIDVYKVLEEKGLTVAGGRTTPVGVGGLTLQGGISFYSPLYGLVCSTVTAYEIVLADGTATTVSESSHPDLWRALKGGGNNFGIVTSFTVPCFPAGDIWFSATFGLGFQAPGLLRAFHDYIADASSGRPGSFDPHATVPITSFGYMQNYGIRATANFLGHTKPSPQDKGRWPAHWRNSAFGRLYNLWDTSKVQSVSSAAIELSVHSPENDYNTFAVTTIQNDMATLEAAYQAWLDATTACRGVKGMVLTLALQVILPGWMHQGHPNALGLEGCDQPLVIIELPAKWVRASDEPIVRREVRRAIEAIDAFAQARGTGHRYRFANYCAEWQDPMRSYGPESLALMRGVSTKYDPDALFQRGCAGGGKLGVGEGFPARSVKR